MAKSNKTARGGARPGAGRKPKSTKVDWNEVGRAYFVGREHAHQICTKFGLGMGDLLAYAAARGWVWPSPDGHPDDCGELGSALAVAMFGTKGLQRRARLFVSAMVALEAPVADIAAALHLEERELRAEFSNELARTS